jgi:hypothetical protein
MSKTLTRDHFLCYYCKNTFLHKFVESIDCLSCERTVCRDCYRHKNELFQCDDHCIYCEITRKKDEHVKMVNYLFDFFTVTQMLRGLNQEYTVSRDKNGSFQIHHESEKIEEIKEEVEEIELLKHIDLSDLSDEEYESMSD